MRAIPKLTQRQVTILCGVVELFVRDGRPVSSAQIQAEVTPDISTATIRAELYRLEKIGLVQKNYSSSARYPTELGFRYYGEEIIRSATRSDKPTRQRTRTRVSDQEDFLNRALISLAQEARAIAFAAYPPPQVDPIAHFQISLWQHRLLVLTLLFQSGWVASRSVPFRLPVGPEVLFDEISERVSRALHGLQLEDIREELVAHAIRKMPSRSALTRLIYHFIVSQTGTDRLWIKEPPIEVLENRWDQEILYPVRAALSDPSVLTQVFKRIRSLPEIVWGTDLRPHPIPGSVFILTNYEINTLQGYLGIAGSQRLDYRRAVQTLQEFSYRLSSASSI